MAAPTNRGIEFFDTQFQRQIRDKEFVLNPFEESVLPYLRGRVLDLGCGLGNLTIEAARRGCSVLALDASAHAIERIRTVAAAESLSVEATVSDLVTYQISEDFDVIVSIGLLMFLKRRRAKELLSEIQRHVRPGGNAIIFQFTNPPVRCRRCFTSGASACKSRCVSAIKKRKRRCENELRST